MSKKTRSGRSYGTFTPATDPSAKMGDVSDKVDELKAQMAELMARLHADGDVIKSITGSVSAKLSGDAAGKRSKGQSVLQMFQPAPFKGQLHEDGIEFVQKFEIYAKQAKYEEDERLPLVVCFLKDKALLWYEALEETDDAKKSFKDFVDAFKAKFATKELSYAERLELLLRTQGPDEDVELYIYDIFKRFQRCDTPEAERLHIFLKGLLPAIRGKLLEKNLQTFKEACTEAISIQKSNWVNSKFWTQDRKDDFRNYQHNCEMTILVTSYTTSHGLKGAAFSGGVCTDYSNGFINIKNWDTTSERSQISRLLTHEVAHLFSIFHDKDIWSDADLNKFGPCSGEVDANCGNNGALGYLMQMSIPSYATAFSECTKRYYYSWQERSNSETSFLNNTCIQPPVITTTTTQLPGWSGSGSGA